MTSPESIRVQMKMVAHQAARVHLPLSLCTRLRACSETLSILAILENVSRHLHGMRKATKDWHSGLSAVLFDFVSIDAGGELLYNQRMTELVSFRPSRSKRELRQAFGNVSRKVNELIERELAKPGPADWRDVLQRKRPIVADKDYDKCLRPE